MVGNPYALEERIQLVVLSSPICLHGKNLSVKETFDKVLKIMKALKDLRFVFKSVNPNKLDEIIYKTHIVLLPTKRLDSRSPNIREHKL
jgi:hypothetical protein